MEHDLIKDKTIKELVELVEEEKVVEIVIENEIDNVQYIIGKAQNGNGVNINISPIKKPEKKPKYEPWEGNPDKNLEKALDYIDNPFPKVSTEVLDQYKLFLKAEVVRLEAVLESFRSEINYKKEKLEQLGNSNDATNLKNEIGIQNLKLHHIKTKIGTIKNFISKF